LARSSNQPGPTGPLRGFRIVDMTTVLMGPYATQIAADYGADVIKIEPPEGDVMRVAGSKRHRDMGPLFLHANRNKRSVALDIRRPEGRDALLRLCEGADAIVHNIRPAAMARLGLAYADIARVNPRIVHVGLVGYGRDGPYAGRPAYDDLIQAASGMASMFELAGDQAPRYVPSVIADRISGLNAVHALLAALLHRERTGEGQDVEVPMFESVAQIVLGDHLGGLSFDPPAGPPGYSRLISPNRRPYRTRDGFVSVLIYNDRQWRSFFEAIGRLDIWENDPRFADQATRALHFDEAYAMLAEVLTGRTTAEWLALFEEHDLPAMPVTRVEALEHDPHLAATGFVQRVEHPTEGAIKQIRPAQAFSKTPPGIFRHAPNLGEHTREVLAEAGLDPRQIDALVAGGAARQFRDAPHVETGPGLSGARPPAPLPGEASATPAQDIRG
jgi:crotonobetainyl-CoA:carnitine CoA-transferase CaiB-like acyl-CoA transferase